MELSFSIIVPTFNRCAALERTLNSLTKIDSRKTNYEVLIIDNGSTDGTSEMIEGFRSRLQCRVISEPMPGLLSARHRGAIESGGDICVFIDDDVRLDPDWLNAFQDAFTDSSIVLVGGPSRPLFEVNPPPWLDAFQSVEEAGALCVPLSLFDGGNKMKEIDPIYIFGLNFAIRRKTLFAQSGFHPDSLPGPLQRYQGDGETGLSIKIKQSGLKAMYHPNASVRHEVPASRLTEEYFQRRAFFQGVCDSYTQIRTDGGLCSKRAQWEYPLARVKRAISKWFSTKRARACVTVTAKAYQRGFEFHQVEVGKDPSLLNWVLQRDYWDYQLPAGWEKYLPATNGATNLQRTW
jgi:glucosyl-dolichyl phosphate glucuronosyltransferase